MEGHIEPAPDGEVWRVLPRLQTVAMRQIVCGFPVVEGLVTILDGREECGCEVCGEENIEGSNWPDSEGRGGSTSTMPVSGLPSERNPSPDDVAHTSSSLHAAHLGGHSPLVASLLSR